MNTPIFDFIEKYNQSNSSRLHMPGHKGKSFLGCEHQDITEISGADSLFEASGIIAESEANASELFGCHTFYSTEGSSHCIRAAVYLLKLCGCKKIYASRNAHKAFISACALNGIDPIWLYPSDMAFLSGLIDAKAVEAALSKEREKCALYLTSPDYLGNICDIESISRVCKRYGASLFVDNAHGAYLKFLSESKHPIDLGADMCCDSAHKTLPVLTGGAYLHISKNAPDDFKANAKNALSLFGSTSPSYLILASLDIANRYIENGYTKRLTECILCISEAKKRIKELGFDVADGEKLKIVIRPKGFGYYGFEIAKLLEKQNIHCEFSDRDHTVFMLTPENGISDIKGLTDALGSVKRRKPIDEPAPCVTVGEKVMTLRDAVFAKSETIKAENSLGKTVAQFNVACPPAVPISVCGEKISAETLKCFEYYGIDRISVVKD